MDRKWWKVGAFVIGGCLLLKYFEEVVGFAGGILDVLTPLLLGCVIAYVLNIVLRFLEKHYRVPQKYRWLAAWTRPVCILLDLGIIVLILTAVVGLVLPEIVNSAKILGESIPTVIDDVINFLSLHAVEFPEIQAYLENFQLNWPKLLENMLGFATSGIGSLFSSAITIAGEVFGGVVNLGLGFIFAIYLLANKERLSEQLGRLCRAYLPKRVREVGLELLRLADDTFSSFLVGQCTEAVILGVLCTIGMLLLRLPYAVMTGVVVGVTALVPIVGAFLGAALGAFMILMVDPMKALIFLIFLVILQQLEENLIYPRVVGSSVGLPGIWVLAAVTVGGGLSGVLGMLVGVPLAATAYKWIGRQTKLRLEGGKSSK